MENHIDDKFVDVDLTIQRQQMKKFLQDQKQKQGRRSNNSNHPPLLPVKSVATPNELSPAGTSGNLLKGGKQSYRHVKRFTTIGEYYMDLKKRQKRELQQEENVGEVVSGEEFEEDD